MLDEVAIQLRYAALDPVLDERGRRRFAAAEARSAGWGGVSALSRITGMARSTIGRGLAELRGAATEVAPGRVRRAGGGRKKLTSGDATLLDDLRELVEPATRGDPQAPLLWTSKSQRHLAAASGSLGHRIGHNAVASVLRELGYSLQSNRKTREGSNHPDRDAQFGYINAQTSEALTAGQPAISVDTKKKELVGDFKNGGNAGWVSVGIDHDTASYKRRQRSLSHVDGKEPLCPTSFCLPHSAAGIKSPARQLDANIIAHFARAAPRKNPVSPPLPIVYPCRDVGPIASTC